MFLTKEKARARLTSQNNLANRFGKHAAKLAEEIPVESETSNNHSNITEISLHRPINANGKFELPQNVVDEIAIRARAGESQHSIAKDFDIAQSSVSEIKNGKTPKSKAAEVDSVLTEIRDRALEKLMKSMGFLNDDKLSACSAKDLSSIAANMSRVVERTIPHDDTSGTRVNVVIYTPEPRQEKYYKTVEI